MSERVPVFTDDDHNNLELVREIVLDRLRRDNRWNQFDYDWAHTENFVESAERRLRNRFVVLANEVMWHLVIQGVITPGLNASNPTLPFFRITAYGQKVLEERRFSPHDPTRYLEDVRAAAKTTVGQVTISYVEEALRCFNAGCHVAAVLLLGVAAESVFWELSDHVSRALKKAAEKKTFDELPENVKTRHRWIVDKFENLPKKVRREHLPESLDITLKSLGDLIRRQRNALGHPQLNLPAVDRELAFVFFKLFPTYVKDLEVFADYIRTYGL